MLPFLAVGGLSFALDTPGSENESAASANVMQKNDF